jgi:tetratricopeptide (TPR) repeat protein
MVDVAEPPLALWDELSKQWSSQDRSEEAEAADEALLERVPSHLPALIRSSWRAVAREEFDVARSLTSRLPENEPDRALLEAEIAAQIESAARAVEVIDAALQHHLGDERLLAALAKRREGAGDLNGARQAYDRWEKVVSRQGLTKVFLMRARMEERAAEHAKALRLYERARYYGAEIPALRGIARVSERMGDLRRAQEIYKKLASTGGDQTAADRAKLIEQRINRAKLEGSLRER